MVKFVVIHKLGNMETSKVDNMEYIYKKCKFRKKENFEKRCSWSLDASGNKVYIHVFAKNAGRHQNINKYELPPPVDKDLFYGGIAIVATRDKEVKVGMDITKEKWEKIYEKLMGGFEELDGEGEEEEEEYIPDEFKTKQGYSTENNFIVHDNDIEYNSSSTSPSEDEYEFTDNETPSDESYKGDDEGEDTDNDDKKKEQEQEQESESDDEEEIEEDELTDPDSELSEEMYVKENEEN